MHQATAPTEPLTAAQVKARLEKAKSGQKILWPYRGDVEDGDVLFTSSAGVDVCWLRGHSSSNDTVPFDEVLAIFDKSGPELEIFPFNGPGYITEAGLKWIADHPRN